MRVLLLGLIPLLTRAWVPRSNLPMAEKHRKSLTSKLPFALTSKVPFAFPITLSPAIRPMDYREIMTPKRSKQRGYIQRIALTALILVGLTQPVWASQVLSSGASAIHPTASASMGTAPLATPLMHRPTAGYALASPVSVWTELQLASRLVYSAVLGAAVGKERSVKNRRTAGIRTMALVSLGASLFTICSVYGFPAGDPSRMASNVASGVGFVGAGVITTTSSKHGDRKENFVHGLTTAAAIWLRYVYYTTKRHEMLNEIKLTLCATVVRRWELLVDWACTFWLVGRL